MHLTPRKAQVHLFVLSETVTTPGIELFLGDNVTSPRLDQFLTEAESLLIQNFVRLCVARREHANRPSHIFEPPTAA